MGDITELHYAQEQVEISGLLNTLRLFNARVRIADQAHVVVHQELQVNLARINPSMLLRVEQS
jgi:hypothetical protein